MRGMGRKRDTIYATRLRILYWKKACLHFIEMFWDSWLEFFVRQVKVYWPFLGTRGGHYMSIFGTWLHVGRGNFNKKKVETRYKQHEISYWQVVLWFMTFAYQLSWLLIFWCSMPGEIPLANPSTFFQFQPFLLDLFMHEYMLSPCGRDITLLICFGKIFYIL